MPAQAAESRAEAPEINGMPGELVNKDSSKADEGSSTREIDG